MAIRFLSGQTIDGALSVTGNVQAATFNTLPIATGVNNVANQIVRTQANGYVDFGWINSISGNHTGSITRITASNDQYLRYVTPAQFRTGVTDGFYAPASTVSGVTSVATGNGLTGGTITSTGTLTMSGSYTGDFSATGDITADQFISTNNGNGQNYRIGDDVWLGDINVANTFRVQGNQNPNNGYITFGNSSNTQLGRAGTGALTWGGDFETTGDVTVSGGDITLGGTGRIQGVDTVTASTDAANKAYVDAHPGSGGTVTSVATGSGLTGGTITTTGTLSVDSTVIRTTGNQIITGNTVFIPSSTGTGYSTAAIELMGSSSGTGGTPPRISWHWGGVVASLITIEANGTIAVRNNPGNDYEQFKASTITATSSMLSPIYYDAVNSAYYGDFASTSVFNKINTGIGNLGSSRSVSYSMTAGNWYRIANGSGRSCGDIYIQDGISGGPHGNLTFYAGSSYAQYAGTMLKLKSSSFYNIIGFTEIRLLIGTTYQDQYVEIYCQKTGSYNITVQDTHYATNQWVLSTSATIGSVPSGYSDSTRLDINGMLIAEAGNGSNRFAVDRVGAIHLSGGSSGSSGQVLTSGGTGSPTWTTLQNQTGGPFLPLAGGTVTGLTNLLAGSKIVVQNGTDGGASRGIFMWTNTDSNWGIYMSTPGSTNNIGGGTAPSGLNGETSHSIRFRIAAGAANGFIWENNNNATLMSMNGNSGNLTTGASMRSPIFYDSDNTAYYGDFASTSNMFQGYYKGKTDGWSLQLGDADLTRVYDDDARASLVINAAYYPHLYINANTSNSNFNHGAVFSMTGNISGGGFRRWSMGIPNTDPNMLTIGTYDNQDNPHYGCGGDVLGEATWGSKFWLDSSSNLQTNGSMRSPIFYDSDNTAYYGDFASTSNFNTLTLAGSLTVQSGSGTMNGKATQLFEHGYGSDSGTFYQTSGSFAGYSGWANYWIGNHGNGANYYNTVDIRPFWGQPKYSRLENNILRGPYNYVTNEVDQTIGVYLQSTTSLRAPIFYDYNNTAFYLDPSTTGTSVNVAGDVVAYASSDIRFKNNVTPITNALDKLSKIGGYTFEWNEISHKETGKKDIGVVAQEVEEVLPEIVQTRSNGYKAVDYQKLTALLIESVKEQQFIIDDLKSRIERLEKI